MIIFLFNIYLILCFHNILQSVFLLSQRKPEAFLFCGVGVSIINLSSVGAASVPGPDLQALRQFPEQASLGGHCLGDLGGSSST